MAGLRNSHGICPQEVIRFLLDLFKYNDNSKNRFSDNYYKAALIDALGASITPVISVVQPGWVCYKSDSNHTLEWLSVLQVQHPVIRNAQTSSNFCFEVRSVTVRLDKTKLEALG